VETKDVINWNRTDRLHSIWDLRLLILFEAVLKRDSALLTWHVCLVFLCASACTACSYQLIIGHASGIIFLYELRHYCFLLVYLWLNHFSFCFHITILWVKISKVENFNLTKDYSSILFHWEKYYTFTFFFFSVAKTKRNISNPVYLTRPPHKKKHKGRRTVKLYAHFFCLLKAWMLL